MLLEPSQTGVWERGKGFPFLNIKSSLLHFPCDDEKTKFIDTITRKKSESVLKEG